MTIFEIIITIVLIALIVIIGYFAYQQKENKQQPNFDTTPIKEALARMESDLKNNFSGLTNDQKEAISKWTIALEKLGTNDTSINNLKQQLENLVKFSDEKFTAVNTNQSDSALKLNQAFLKLEENLKNIDTLKTNVQSLNNIFYNTKSRGNLGEFALNSILTNILGENSKVWETQSRLNVEDNKSQTGNIDVLINMGEKEKIAIDAKFPLEQYQAINKAISENVDPTLVNANKVKFKAAVKDKIKEVKKYINVKNNITHAILFVPSEAIFSYLNNDMQEIFDDSFRERIWICSPTTLAALLHIISQIQKDHELNKNIIKVKKIINEIGDEYYRFNQRWEVIKKKLLDNETAIKNLDTTINKIQVKQEKLNDFNLEE